MLHVAIGGWLPFNTTCVFVFATVFVYGVFASGASVGTMQYALSTFSGIVVAFVNPKSEVGLFRAILLDTNFRPNWSGRFLCEAIFVPGLALLLSFLALALNPCVQQ